MDAVIGSLDPYVTSEIISAMGKELKLTRSKIKELESLPEECKQRAETAEQALGTMKTRFEEISTENNRLREEMRTKETIMELGEGAIRKESQSMNVDADIVQNLRQELETYREKYHAERDAKIRLRDDCNYLKTLKAQQERDYQGLKERFEKERASWIQSNKSVIAPVTIQECAPIEKVFDYMATTYPKFQPRPSNTKLLPVFSDFEDLKIWLTYTSASEEPRYTKLKNNLVALCLPDRVAWCPSNETHGLAFGSMHLFNKNQWTEDATTFANRIHLFFIARGAVYYAGLYNVIELISKFPNGISVQYSRTPEWKALAKVTAKDQEAKVEVVLAKLCCKEGLVEPLGLQCAGFDFNVYRLLTKRYSSLHPSEEPKSKKRKRN